MTLLGGEEQRRIVPRWRSPEATVEAGEFESVISASRTPTPDVSRELEVAKEQWKATPNMGSAAELVASSILADQTNEAFEAAEYIVAMHKSAGGLLLRRARELLGVTGEDYSHITADAALSRLGDAASPESYAAVRTRIEPLKERVRANPRDALAWLEMGRIHATVGNQERAMRSVRIAASLAGDNRFVLRSASRFFLHAGEADVAHDLLRRSPRTKFDPWMSAAEIATAQVADISPKTIRTGQRLIDSGSFSDHALSELRAALGTAAAVDGRKKAARRYLEASLKSPTENAVAQAIWLARREEISGLSSALQNTLDTPRSYEARSRASYNKGDWEEALDNAQCWFDDEPFSGRAAVHGAFIGSLALERFEDAIQMLRAALRASPANFVLQANLLYNLAVTGELIEAAELLRNLRLAATTPSQRVVVLANEGLLAFRSGDSNRGRPAYVDAIELALANNLKELHQQAVLFFLIEELHAKNREIIPEAVAALAETGASVSPDVRMIQVQVRRDLARLVQS
jgi:tetratricopeptide (TPR) repeat protein